MKHFFIVLTLGVYSLSVKAQTAEDSVRSTINNMFAGMKNADVALLRSAFADSMLLQTIGRDKDGNMVVKNESPAEFLELVAKESAGNLDERIQFETIKVDGPLAMVWTPYSFYYKGQFSHCGVNSFQLVRLNGAWKIQYIIDTRRRTGCKLP